MKGGLIMKWLYAIGLAAVGIFGVVLVFSIIYALGLSLFDALGKLIERFLLWIEKHLRHSQSKCSTFRS